MLRKSLCLCMFAAGWLVSSDAWAGKYDLDLTPLGGEHSSNGDIVPDNDAFRSIASEVGVLVAPKPVDPADTLGLSGFAIAADVSLTTISNGASYWKDTVRGAPDTVLPTIQVLGRKGLWPGLEVGAGATKVLDSRMWAMSGYGKAALHEGFHHLPIPSIAIRGMFSTLLGSKDLRLTTASIGASVSHVFGIGNTFSLTPYVGYQTLFVMARTGVIDATPGNDELDDGAEPCDDPMPDADGNATCFNDGEFVFRKQDPIIRHRPYVGVRFIFSVLRLGLEAMFVPAGSTSSSVALSGGGNGTATDRSGFQQQYTISLGLDF